MQNIFGFLNINKPPNCTSHDVINVLRKNLDIKKIGHAGTLDPFATGVLVIGINKATKLFQFLPQDKVYLAEITFGISTDTDDITGNTIEELADIPTLNGINEKLNTFTGKLKQKPPIFSAVKINGNRAYKLARNNQISLDKMKEKDVEVYSIEIVSYDDVGVCHGVRVCHGKPLLTLKIHCSGGTYIRSLARDLGKALNSCATLSKLERVKACGFNLEDSLSLDLITKFTLSEYLISPKVYNNH